MKKIIPVILSALILASALFIPVLALDESEAKLAPGGTLTAESDADEVARAFGGSKDSVDNSTRVEISGSVGNYKITLCVSIKFTAPLIIEGGEYEIKGSGCGIYRGFAEGALIQLDGSNGGSPSLTVERDSIGAWKNDMNTDEDSASDGNVSEVADTADLILDGCRDSYTAASGALISVKGNASLELNGKVKLMNAASTELGGAIYAEAVTNGSGAVYSPSVKLDYCKILNCSSSKGGGAVALVGGKNGEGTVSLNDVIFKENTALNGSRDARGGAVYTDGGELKLSGSCKLLSNSADIGGGAYICGTAEISGDVTVKYNSANADGGAFYCDVGAAERGTAAVLLITKGSVTHNTAGGNGGAIFNAGTVLMGDSASLQDNEAKKDGGAVYNRGSFGVTGGSLYLNKALGKAGAIYNSESGILSISGGSIATNKAAVCGGVYSEGVFDFKGGSIGKNVGDEPQNLVSGIMKMSGAATFTSSEVLGILVGEDGSYTVIGIDGELTSRVKQSVAFFKAEIGASGESTSLKLANKSGYTVFSSENSENLKSAVERFDVYVTGIKKSKLKADGTLGFKMPLMPLWGWALTLLAVLGAAFGTVALIKKLKKRSVCDGQSEESAEAEEAEDGEAPADGEE